MVFRSFRNSCFLLLNCGPVETNRPTTSPSWANPQHRALNIMETSNPTPTTLPSLHHHSQSHHQAFSNSELKSVTVTINDKAQQQSLLAAGAKATRKSSTQRSSSPFKSKQTIVSTRNLLSEEGNGEKEVKVDKMIIRKVSDEPIVMNPSHSRYRSSIAPQRRSSNKISPITPPIPPPRTPSETQCTT